MYPSRQVKSPVILSQRGCPNSIKQERNDGEEQLGVT